MTDFISSPFRTRIVKVFIAGLLICSLSHCKDSETEDVHREPSPNNGPSIDNSSGDNDDGPGCAFDDGTHSATIAYFNPSTNYSATYTLDVEIEDCQVTQINFNNGGYLGPDHIAPTDIDEDGDASVVDDNGRSYDVHIDD
jgi:hypothetical protein